MMSTKSEDIVTKMVDMDTFSVDIVEYSTKSKAPSSIREGALNIYS
jgi:hypothetical protein